MMPEKETVIVVHGTWAAVRSNAIQWYESNQPQAPTNFAARLNRALQQRGSAAQCWAHGDVFSWSGENTWLERSLASLKLASYVTDLQSKGWRCHIVAHSHGGNVVAEALPAIKVTPESPTGITGKVVSLGTPFVDATTPIAQSIVRRGKIATLSAWLFVSILLFYVAFLAVVLSIGFFDFLAPHKSTNLLLPVVLPTASIVALLAYYAIRKELKKERNGWFTYWSRCRTLQRPFFLAVNSSMDEAWQVLHHMRNMHNPLSIKEGIIRYILTQRRILVQRQHQILKIHGAIFFSDLSWHAKIVAVVLIILSILMLSVIPYGVFVASKEDPFAQVALAIGAMFILTLSIISLATFAYGRAFYSAIWSPYRWLFNQSRLIAGLPTVVATYIVRLRGWSIVQQLAFGLEGYRYSLPPAERIPAYMPPNCFKYEDLSGPTEKRALQRRNVWFEQHFADATRTFANIVVTASDIEGLLRTIANDLSLVHAAYYTDEECIERVADWIAGRPAGTTGPG